MNVGDLINELSKHPSDTPVGYTEDDRGAQIFYEFDRLKVREVGPAGALVYADHTGPSSTILVLA